MDQKQSLENEQVVENTEKAELDSITNSVYKNTLCKVLQNYNLIITTANNKYDSIAQLTVDDLKKLTDQSDDDQQNILEAQKIHRLFKLTDQVLNYIFSLNLDNSITKRKAKWVFPKKITNELASLNNIEHTSYTNQLALTFIQQRMLSFEQGSYNSQDQIQALYDAVNIIAYYYIKNEQKPFDHILSQQLSKEYLAYEFQPKYQKFQDETIYLLKQVEDYYAEE